MDYLLRATAAEARHFWFRGLRTFTTPLIRHATARLPTPRVLDCGCGTGANLGLLGTFGRAYGFDLSSVGLRFARESGQTRVARASVAAAPFPSACFDLVTSFDVMYALDEHDERLAVSEIYRPLKPKGYVIVYQTPPFSGRWRSSVCGSAGAGGSTRRDATREIAVPPPVLNAIVSGLLQLERVWLRWFRRAVRQLAGLSG